MILILPLAEILLMIILTQFAWGEKILIGYDNESPECQEYLAQNYQGRFLQESDKLNDSVNNIIKSKKSLRDYLLKDLANSIVKNKVRSKTNLRMLFNSNNNDYIFSQIKENTASETVHILPAEIDSTKARQLQEKEQDMYPTINWLKHVQIDETSLPQDFDPVAIQKDLLKISCIEFADISSQIAPQSFSEFRDLSDEKIRKNEFLFKEHVVKRRTTLINDPLFSEQWQLEDIGLLDAWDLWKVDKNAPPIIGSIDLGCDIKHPDLNGSIWKNPGEICDNGIDDDNNGYVDDCHGYDFHKLSSEIFDEASHGTYSAGVMAAQTNNGIGMAGICPECKVICAKIGDAGLYLDAFVLAINYLISLKIKIITYGGIGYESQSQNAAIRAARDANIVFVTSAGNSACDFDNDRSACIAKTYPAVLKYSNMISVASTTEEHIIASYSSYGSNNVDIAAPSSLYAPRSGSSNYTKVDGTSFSAPSVAAILAYVWNRYPSLTVTEIRRVVLDSAVLHKNLTGKIQSGVVNAHHALMLGYAYSALKLDRSK